MKKATLLLGVGIVFLSGFAWGQISTAAIQPEERAALTPNRQLIEKGQAIAENACAKCHGLNGISTVSGQPHLAGQRTVYLYRVLQEYQTGARTHAPMNQLSGILNSESLLAVAAYYANLPPPRLSTMVEPDLRAEMVEDDPFSDIRPKMKKCVKCHGETGNSTASGMPSLTAQDPDYFVKSMQAYIDGSRDHKLMQKLAQALDEQTITEMAVFYAVQVPERTSATVEGDTQAGRAAAEECAGCHGADGNAAGSDVPSLAGQDARYFVKAMLAYQGRKRQHEPMFNAVEDLGEEEIKNLAAFYAGQEPVKRNVRQPLSTTQWIDRCERCHGIDGNSTDPRFPALAGQDETYLRAALESYTGATRSDTAMHAMSAPLSEADVQRIAAYYATREPKSIIYMQLPCEETVVE